MAEAGNVEYQAETATMPGVCRPNPLWMTQKQGMLAEPYLGLGTSAYPLKL